MQVTIAEAVKQRRAAVAAARQVVKYLADPRFQAAIEVAERHAGGQATDQELAIAESGAACADYPIECVEFKAVDFLATVSNHHSSPAPAAELAAAKARRDRAASRAVVAVAHPDPGKAAERAAHWAAKVEDLDKRIATLSSWWRKILELVFPSGSDELRMSRCMLVIFAMVSGTALICAAASSNKPKPLTASGCECIHRDR